MVWAQSPGDSTHAASGVEAGASRGVIVAALMNQQLLDGDRIAAGVHRIGET